MENEEGAYMKKKFGNHGLLGSVMVMVAVPAKSHEPGAPRER